MTYVGPLRELLVIATGFTRSLSQAALAMCLPATSRK